MRIKPGQIWELTRDLVWLGTQERATGDKFIVTEESPHQPGMWRVLVWGELSVVDGVYMRDWAKLIWDPEWPEGPGTPIASGDPGGE